MAVVELGVLELILHEFFRKVRLCKASDSEVATAKIDFPKRRSEHELQEKAAKRPNVSRLALLMQRVAVLLWSHVLVSADCARVRTRTLRFDSLSDDAKTEVTKFGASVLSDEHVGRLDVSVDQVLGMDVPDGLTDIDEVAHELTFTHASLLLFLSKRSDPLCQVSFRAVLHEHQVKVLERTAC